MPRGPARTGIREVLDGDEVREILRDTFFAPAAEPVAAPETLDAKARRAPGERTSGEVRVRKPRPEHYKVICISMYTEDLERLDAVVRELKRRGFTKANRSAVLRYAMEQLDLSRVPKGL